MIIIGADYHPGFQQIAFVDTETGDYREQQLQHPEEAEKFYRELAAQGMKVRVGMEASGHARWFERLLAGLNFELWIGDAAEIQTKRVRKPKTDREDARLLLRLLMEDRFPRIWVPSWDNRDLRQLLWHRHRMVQARTRIMNQLQAVALNEGLRFKKRLWREAGRQQLESFPLAPWANRRRHDLLELLDRLNPTIAELSQAVEQEVEKCPEAQCLMTHPGVGPLTALAFVLIIGTVERFQCGKQIASYLGLVPLEKSSGSRRRSRGSELPQHAPPFGDRDYFRTHSHLTIAWLSSLHRVAICTIVIEMRRRPTRRCFGCNIIRRVSLDRKASYGGSPTLVGGANKCSWRHCLAYRGCQGLQASS